MSKQLILTVGLPCSGKTLFAKYLLGLKKNLFRVSAQDIYRMVDNKFDERNTGKYLAIQEALVLRALEFGDVIVDNNNLRAAERAAVIRSARLIYSDLRVVVYQMARNLANCKIDNSKRPILDEAGFFSRLEDFVMDELGAHYELPQLDEDIQLICGVLWEPSDHFMIGNLRSDHRPKIFEIASKKVTHVVDRPDIGRATIIMSDDE